MHAFRSASPSEIAHRWRALFRHGNHESNLHILGALIRVDVVSPAGMSLKLLGAE